MGGLVVAGDAPEGVEAEQRVREWVRGAWREPARVSAVGEVRLRYYVRGRTRDGARRHSEDPEGPDPLDMVDLDGVFETLFAALISVLFWLVMLLPRMLSALWRLVAPWYRRRCSVVIGKPRQAAIQFADAVQGQPGLWLVWASSRMALVRPVAEGCEVVWEGRFDRLPSVHWNVLRWIDGSKVRLPKRVLRG
ncbi:hypothetical protein GCM10010452_06130 [Crossiella cryophila]